VAVLLNGDRDKGNDLMSPPARIYGGPCDPSDAVYDESNDRAIASGTNAPGQDWNASCTEQLQFEMSASARPLSAGETATMCASL
jgi:hypothetical protein